MDTVFKDNKYKSFLFPQANFEPTEAKLNKKIFELMFKTI